MQKQRAYNTNMRIAYVAQCQSPKVLSIASLLVCLATPATAQTQSTLPAPTGRPDQTIQLIRTEDAGSRIDEVRVGGQTQSITVQPKVVDNLPAYEVKPLNSARGPASPNPNSDTTGARVWNVLKF